MRTSPLAGIRAQIRYRFHVDPDTLSTEQFAQLWAELEFLFPKE